MLEFFNTNAGVITLFFTAVVAIATVFYVRLTSRLVDETISLRKAQTQPHISVSILPRDPEVWIVDMIIENVGNGSAHNLKLTPSDNFEMRVDREFNNIGFVKNGYNYFAPHQKLKFFFTSLIDDREKKRNIKFTINLSYKDQFGEEYVNEYKVDLSEFYGIPRFGNPPIYDIAESLRKIEEFFTSLERKMLDVNIYTEEDRIRIKKEKKVKIENDYKERKEKNQF